MKFTSSVRHNISDIYWESHWLQWLYSTGTLWSGRVLAQSSNPYSSLVRICNATRRIRNRELRVSRLQTFSDYLRRHFGSHPPHSLAENLFVKGFLKSEEAEEARRIWRKYPLQQRLNLRGNLILLKAPRENERGVLLLTYTRSFDFFLINFNLGEISNRYVIVLEPSWATFPEPYMGLFSCSGPRNVCEMISHEAAETVHNAQIPIQPIAIGAQDWVDTEIFKPLPGVQKDFDAVVIANFAPWKRHAVLFRAMQKLRPRRIRVALVGVTWERTRKEFEEEIRRYGVQDDCTIFQGISPIQVNEVLNRSKVKILLTKIEGANRALSEAMSANVPVLVYKHIMGPRRTDINPMTGVYADDDELPDALIRAIESYKRFEPREWYLQNSGYQNSTSTLNEALRQAAHARNENWTTDIVGKVNRPYVEYVSVADRTSLTAAWRELEQYICDLG